MNCNWCVSLDIKFSINNTNVLTREPQWTKRKVKEAVVPYKKKNAPSMNRELGYQLPPIYHQLLLPDQFQRRKTSRGQNLVEKPKRRDSFKNTIQSE